MLICHPENFATTHFSGRFFFFKKQFCLPVTLRPPIWQLSFFKGRQTGGFKRGGFPIWTCPSFFVLFGTFPIFPGFSRFARGRSGDFPDSCLFSFSAYWAPTRNSPERVRDTIWTFPEKSGKPPGLETPLFSFSQILLFYLPLTSRPMK